MPRLFTVPSGATVEIDDNHYITTEVVLSPDALVEHTFEEFLDLLSLAATDTELLMDINYTPKSITPDENIVFEVTGDISEILNSDDSDPDTIDVEDLVEALVSTVQQLDDIGDIVETANLVLPGTFMISITDDNLVVFVKEGE